MSKATDILEAAATFAAREPAVLRGVLYSVVALLVGLGLPQVANLSDEIDTILQFIAYIAPLVAGISTRRKVTPFRSALDQGIKVD